ncbi:hypothetical protein BN140_1794 [Methanoculleus bourgensis MS2]|jgi:nucleoside-diphosphate-sugar epimerase|uniref:Uncharacterized protein n=1 Tax=Methanoculleus bourgensis (strain ATCC 43281 / DSM 3045 / OCM 15 / MS2) TaxID=1201294 RepID=I7LK81_METBM|nr:hypothetical protein BN140_1794 [Methanoculleus bourgensis MS2]
MNGYTAEYKYATIRIHTDQGHELYESGRDLKHNPQVPPEEGIKRTVEWMKWFYRLEE